MGDLEVVLSWLGMSRYLDIFVEAGFDTWETVLEITEPDLEYLNVDLGSRRKLQREIASTKRLTSNPTFNQPLYTINPHPGMPPHSIPDGHRPSPAEVPTKRGYRHHPKPDPNAPERPYSAYVLFSNDLREKLKKQNLSFADLSKEVGERWQSLPTEEREAWKQMGAAPWDQYKAEMAEYQKTDKHQEYQQYLANFKATQAAKKPERAKTQSQHGQSSLHKQGKYPTGISPPKSDGQVESRRPEPKVAIKRLKKEEEDWSLKDPVFQPHARQSCEPCRKRKIKCGREEPICRQCRENGGACHYEKNERAKQKQKIEDLWAKVRAYEALLVKVAPQLDEDDQWEIQEALHLPPRLEGPTDAPQIARKLEQPSNEGSDEGGGGESDVSGVGSMGPTDRVNQDDFEHEGAENRATAYVGQASDIKWLQKVEGDLKPSSREGKFKDAEFPRGIKPSLSNGLSASEDSIVGHQVDPFDLPPRDTADALVQAYFGTVHLSFPLINRDAFVYNYDLLYSVMDTEDFDDRMFLAAFYLVLAIAATHAHLVEAQWSGHDDDHALYFAKARIVAVDAGILNDAVQFAYVQVLGLASMYMLVTNQINRAFNLTGLSIRTAQVLGLHLTDVTPSSSTLERELFAHSWFAIASLESILTTITGRPSMVRDRDASVAMPHSGAEESSASEFSPSEQSMQSLNAAFSNQPSSSSTSETSASIFFSHYADLCMLMTSAVTEMYNPGIRRNKWSKIQKMIQGFDQRLVQWQKNLTPPFDVAESSSDHEIESCRVALRILFYSVRTIINRPGLCRLSVVDDQIERQAQGPRTKQSSSSKRTNHILANRCVESARSVLTLILDKPESTILHHGPVWWMLLHHIKRAIIVLLLELTFRAEHMPAEAGGILQETKRGLEWLRRKGHTSSSARNSWVVLSRLLQGAAERVGGTATDIETAPEIETTSHGQMPDHGSPQSFGFDPVDPDFFSSSGIFGGGYAGEIGNRYFGDVSASNWLDNFGFLHASGGQGSFFPLPSEYPHQQDKDQQG